MSTHCYYCELDEDGYHEADCPKNPDNVERELSETNAMLEKYRGQIASLIAEAEQIRAKALAEAEAVCRNDAAYWASWSSASIAGSHPDKMMRHSSDLADAIAALKEAGQA